MKIKGYLLKDIQSWDDKSGAVSPATDRMNVIIAPSETGKSVVIKVLKEMCFSGQWGYTWSSLIKRGASFGVAVFILEDDTMVCYYIMPFMVKYVLIYPDGNRRIWESKEQNNTEIPEEIAQKMGLIVDRDAKTVINVLDKDMVTPFVTASQEMNARIAKVITAVPEMEKRINTLKEWKYYLDSALVNVKVDYNSSKLGYDRLPSIDVLGLKSKLNKMKILRDFILPVESIVKYFSDKEIPIEPEVVKLPECIEDFLSVMNSINEYCKIADIVKTMVKPKEVVFNEESIGTLITAIKGISELGNQLVVVSKEQKPIEKVNPIDVKEIVDLIKLVTDYGLLLKSYEEPPKLIKAPDSSIKRLIELHKIVGVYCKKCFDVIRIQKPIEKKEVSDCDSLIVILKLLDGYDWDTMERFCNTYREVKGVFSRSKNKLLLLQKELKICPTCGRPFIDNNKGVDLV